MKILKPQSLSLLTRVFEEDGQAYVVLTAMAFIPFDAPRKLLHEVTLWKAAADELGKDAVLDVGMSKRRGEVLVAGKAFARDGKPTPATSVKLEVGEIKKELYVIGDRTWGPGGPSDPEPFLEMPITWERAFGGEGFAKNPVGKGFKPVDVDGKRIHPLPNVESRRQLVVSPGDRPEPVGFGPLDQTWPQRMSLAGTYDGEWLRTRFPGVAADFDWEFYNVAPADQRAQGYFTGEEVIRVEGMHPARRVQELKLPGLTARLFIVPEPEPRPEAEPGAEGGGLTLREATARLDTIYLLPNIERAILIFRGMLPISDDDGRDVKHVLAAFEDRAAPRPVEHYRSSLERRLDKRKGALLSLIDDDLVPAWEVPDSPVPEDDWNDMAKVVQREELHLAYMTRNLDKQIRDAREHIVARGLDPAEFDRQMAKRPELPPQDVRALPAYIEKMQSELDAAEEQAKKHRDDALDRAREGCQKLGLDFDKLVEERKASGGGPPRFSADKELERMRDLRDLGRNAGADVSALDAKLADPAFEAQLRAAEQRLLEVYRRFTQFFPPADAPGEAARLLREEALAAHARGESLARRDLTGADLSGADLSGADLTEALLEGCDLRGARLCRARLEGATLARGDLREADLEGAQLGQANFGWADLRGARLTGGAALSRAVFYKADLRGASLAGANLAEVDLLEAQLEGVDLSGVTAESVIFMESDLTGARLQGARLGEAIFLKAKLARADLSGADLHKATIVECQAPEASLRGADLTGVRLALGSNLEGADLRGATMKQTMIRGCRLVGADLSEVRAPDCDFSESDLSGAKLYRMEAPRSLFIRTVLRGADVRSANLMMAVLQKAELHGADMRGVNLFRADLAKVRGDKATNFKDAYLVQVRVVPEKNQPRLFP